MPMFLSRCLVLALSLPAALAFGQTADAQGASCGPVAIPGHYGPYDYVSERGKLHIVDQYHFTPKVEALIAGESGYLGDDLTYTLNASPNHHRALVAITRYAARTNSPTPPHLRMSVECYFDRATRFRPKDTVVRALYAIYLGQLKRVPEAKAQLDAAAVQAEDNALSHYNLGLTYLELKLYDGAVQEAQRARQLGVESTVLIDKLKAANQWKELAE